MGQRYPTQGSTGEGGGGQRRFCPRLCPQVSRHPLETPDPAETPVAPLARPLPVPTVLWLLPGMREPLAPPGARRWLRG